MDLLAELTPREADRLWWHLVRAMGEVQDEIECLAMATVDVRDMLYGKDVLEQYRGLLAELADLSDTEFDPPTASWTDRLVTTPENGESEWHYSDAPTPSARMTFTRLAARISLARAFRRSAAPPAT